MISVSESEYDKVVSIIRRARNYIGTAGHQVDGTTHYITRNGQQVKAAEHWYDSFCGHDDEGWAVEESIYDKYLTYDV